MDNLSEESRKLSNTLMVWDFGTILQIFRKYAQKEPVERRFLVLEEYFKSLPPQDNAAQLLEIDIVREIFPQIERSYIAKLLNAIGNEENRIRIAIKILVKKVAKIRKRANKAIGNELPLKKLKLNRDNGNPDVYLCDSPQTSILPHNDTLKSFPEKLQSSPLNNVNQPSTSKLSSLLTQASPNHHSTSSFLSTFPQTNGNQRSALETTNLSPSTDTHQSSTSKSANLPSLPINMDQPSTSKSANLLLSLPTNTNQPATSKLTNIHQPSTSKVSNLVDVQFKMDTPLISNENDLRTFNDQFYLDTLPLDTDRDKVEEWLGGIGKLSAVQSNESITQNEVPVINVPIHLHEMFANIPLKYIKALCDKFAVTKHKLPPQHIMNVIISLLVEKSKSIPENQEYIPTTKVSTSRASFRSVVPPSVNAVVIKSGNISKKRKQKQRNGLIVNEIITLDDFTSEEDKQLEAILNQLQANAKKHANEQEEEEDDNGLVYPLMEIFNEACPNFIRQMCKGKPNTPGVLNTLISEILESDYPKRSKEPSPPRQLDSSEQLEIMKSILVDADPDYLRMHCDRLVDNPDKLKEFISEALETRNYPTLKDYLRKKQISAQQKQYTTEFSIEKFLDVIPNPFEYFNDSTRKTNKLDYLSQHYALCYLRNKFCQINLRAIRECFTNNKEHFLLTCKELESFPPYKKMKAKRSQTIMPTVIQNIPLLQEISFYDKQHEIEMFLKEKKLQEDLEREQAKILGFMQTCSCCYDDEVMEKHVACCEAGCVFCVDCVRKGAEVTFGDGKLDFPCLSNCNSHFSLQVLQSVLTPKMFSVIALKKQVEEVKAAGIEDLETCPFCDFVTIPHRDDKLFRCLNPQCMKESCRSCKEPSHVPLRCDEVEKDEDVKARTYIENKMTEALLRTCCKCGMKFFKADGCNKMTCSCGAIMCYVCGKPVKDYNHFNGNGGDKTNLCPLYSDTNQLHKDAILKGAEKAKTEIGIRDSKKLKIDPTTDIQQHYKSDPKRLAPPRPINPFLALNHEEVVLQQRALQMFQQYRRQHN